MKNKLSVLVIMIIILVNCVVPQSFMAQENEIKTIVIDANLLQKVKSGYQSGNSMYVKIVEDILAEVNKFLEQRPLSVMDKSIVPPSGNKHDFMSMGPYWWPDPDKKDGLPYIRRDGERNPEYYKITDQEYISRTFAESKLLALAYYLTGNSKYSSKAVEKIYTWFLDDSTKMNPNMKHAQYIPGINTGRGIGLIETAGIYQVLDAVVILRKSSEWKKEYEVKFNKWMQEYYNWITTHQYGIDESNEKNNHGTWYDVQASSIALFLGKKEAAEEILNRAKEKRIDSQIGGDGRQPLELARTKSWNYSCMNLSAFMHLAIIAEHVNINLWNYSSPKGGSIKMALDYLLPFAQNFDKWEYAQITKFEKENLKPILRNAIKKLDQNLYSEWYKKIFNDHDATLEELLF